MIATITIIILGKDGSVRKVNSLIIGYLNVNVLLGKTWRQDPDIPSCTSIIVSKIRHNNNNNNNNNK